MTAARYAELVTLARVARSNPMRVGRKVRHHLYTQRGPEPSDADPSIGMMLTDVIAEETARVWNAFGELLPLLEEECEFTRQCEAGFANADTQKGTPWE